MGASWLRLCLGTKPRVTVKETDIRDHWSISLKLAVKGNGQVLQFVQSGIFETSGVSHY